ncbi:MAG: Argininosuccinate lyase 1 [Pseudomonadota bacterium]|jgi:argininosuccinate lyase
MLRIHPKMLTIWVLLLVSTSVCAQKNAGRDQFFWLGQINKASAVINVDEGLLDRDKAPKIAAGIVKVMTDGDKPGAARPFRVVEFEPLLIRAAGQEASLLHAGRSSQDMFATYRAAIMRDNLLDLAEQLTKTSETLVRLSEKHAQTIVPNYTNGIAAQPNSLGHAWLGHAAGFERDAQRIREAYARIDRSPMGTTVLNGSSWPLNRTRMANYLGFETIVDNAYDAAQISSSEYPVEVSAIVTSLGLHSGHFIQDIMSQYGQVRPWIFLVPLRFVNTQISSAMPQKQNPILLTETRREISSTLALAMGPMMRAHNITPGMQDPKEESSNTEMVQSAVQFLKRLDRILNALVVDPDRALEELNSDWTASQELADVLMRKYKVPFRVGHHFSTGLVNYGKERNIKPLDFPYAEAKRIYKEVMKEFDPQAEFPMTETEFRNTLNPVSIVQNRATVGGPQSSEMKRMLALAKDKLTEQKNWTASKRQKISQSLMKLDQDFQRLLQP